jgi:hypothetical protein
MLGRSCPQLPETPMFYTPSIEPPARKPTGAKLALKPFHVWGILVRLQVGHRTRLS